MSESYGQEFLNISGAARLVVSRMPWRFALKLMNPQISPDRCRAAISERSVELVSTLDDIKWLIETGQTLSLQFDDNEHEEYGVFQAKLLCADITSSALDLTLAIDESSVEFKDLYQAVAAR